MEKGLPFSSEWSEFLQKAFSRFSDMDLPFAFVLGGEARAFTTTLPGFVLHFPEGGRKGCEKVESFWKRVRFFLKPSRTLEDGLCGGISSFPISILMTARQEETLGGWITEKSFLESQPSKSQYADFFGNSLYFTWMIIDFSALHNWMEDFLLGEKFLARIPFNLLAAIYGLRDLSAHLAFLGVLGGAFSENNRGELIISSDIFNR